MFLFKNNEKIHYIQKCILSILLNGLCVFLIAEYIHINWLSVFLQLLIPILCLNISTKRTSCVRICHFKFDCSLISNNEYPSIPSLTIEYYAFSTILTIGGCAFFIKSQIKGFRIW